MYSPEWFATFADTLDPAITLADVSAIARLCPSEWYPRILEIGCGTGRVAGPLAERGYRVVGLDINEEALRLAKQQAPGAEYVALDQRFIGRMLWTFDAVMLLWNSVGFTSRDDDVTTLCGVAKVLRPGGKFLVDLYHADWLADQSMAVAKDVRGASVQRWVKGGRLFHHIQYPDGVVDHIQFNVYRPDEFIAMAERVGLRVISQMTWWNAEKPPRRACARYQLELEAIPGFESSA